MHTMPNGEHLPRKRRSLVLVASGIGTIIVVVFVIALGVHLRFARMPWEGFRKPDDLKVARELLATKFSGPRYFKYVPDREGTEFPFISATTAQEQAEGIRQARGLSAAQMKKLGKLIDRLSEPPSSRMVGVTRVNVLQLNLALDEMR